MTTSNEEKKTDDAQDLLVDNDRLDYDEDLDIPVMNDIDVDLLAERCLRLLKHSESKDHSVSRCSEFNRFNQVFIGIAGTPGSGKSHIAEAIRDRINEINPSCAGNGNQAEAVVIPMDGYHIPREDLRELAAKGTVFESDQFGDDDDDKVESRQLSYEQLLARRGAPFTYYPGQFIQDLKAAKQNGEGSFPVYSRSKHDPVEDGVRIEKHNKIIFVEGLYLLCTDDPNWHDLEEIWDDKWYIDVSLEETKRRLVERHLQNWDEQKTKQYGGSGREAAARKAETNDIVNAKCIKKHAKKHACLIISNEKVTDMVKDGIKRPSKDKQQILNDSNIYA